LEEHLRITQTQLEKTLTRLGSHAGANEDSVDDHAGFSRLMGKGTKCQSNGLPGQKVMAEDLGPEVEDAAIVVVSKDRTSRSTSCNLQLVRMPNNLQPKLLLHSSKR